MRQNLTDGLHPHGGGHFILAEELKALIRGKEPVSPTPLPNPLVTLFTQNSGVQAVFNDLFYSETVWNPSSSTIGGLSLYLPSNAQMGQTLTYITAGTVTVVSVALGYPGNPGSIVIGAPVTTLAANSLVTWRCVRASNDNDTGGALWARIQ